MGPPPSRPNPIRSCLRHSPTPLPHVLVSELSPAALRPPRASSVLLAARASCSGPLPWGPLHLRVTPRPRRSGRHRTLHSSSGTFGGFFPVGRIARRRPPAAGPGFVSGSRAGPESGSEPGRLGSPVHLPALDGCVFTREEARRRVAGEVAGIEGACTKARCSCCSRWWW
ncbi:uncharacterized protein A4U43_C04F34260 [Asparagus officinalis]|uniref:Uncharacterized protein n=1 Tax=Asparagus officinalis TaxID=4686 RepID=A0A5P1FAZ0_ASPOF|nr:uncharacterized protein A4U43_C04F34260 [Asparagus officinalis]